MSTAVSVALARRGLLVAVLVTALPTCMSARTPEALVSSRAAPVTTIEPVEPHEPEPVEPAVPPSPPPIELPRGGRTIFPEHRLVGFCGTPGAPALGELQGDLAAKAKVLEARASQYGGDGGAGPKILPVFELIAVIVQAWPGADGKYRRRVDDSVVREYLRVARLAKAILLLNVQPGHSDFLTEVKAFEPFLREPDVGLALDPEWAMKPNERPGEFWGQTTASVINSVADYLASLVVAGDLPEKVLVFHEVVRKVVKDETSMRAPPGVVIVKSVDGLGPPYAKVATYANLMQRMAPGVHPGFKLFFYEDTQNGGSLMSASQVLALSPQPEYVMYE